MATIIERDVHHGHTGDDGASAVTMIVAVLAIVLIIGVALFALGALPFAANVGDRGTDIDVDLPNVTTPDIVPGDSPDIDVNQNVTPTE